MYRKGPSCSSVDTIAPRPPPSNRTRAGQQSPRPDGLDLRWAPGCSGSWLERLRALGCSGADGGESRPVRRLTAKIALTLAIAVGLGACEGSGEPTNAEGTVVSSEARRYDGRRPVARGEPIDVASLEGRIVFDDFEDVYVMNADGTNVRPLADRSGSEFDGAWAPDGRWIVYRDSRRGINTNDEIYLVEADGSGVRNLTRNRANDWGPEWSPDGETIAFNSDRDGAPMSGYLVSPEGSNLRRIDAEVWIEYPSFSPDGSRIAFMGQDGADYDIYVADVGTGKATQLTDAPGSDGWPAWSPDGATIAFASQRDDCLQAPTGSPCWSDPGGQPGEHHDVWIMNADGSNERRVTPEFGQFLTWSPDGAYLLISGYSLYVIRPDGTGRSEVARRAGGLPDWIAKEESSP
jgi:dipeptidyl aminopeptidase/acylaminoacyl peptidase